MHIEQDTQEQRPRNEHRRDLIARCENLSEGALALLFRLRGLPESGVPGLYGRGLNGVQDEAARHLSPAETKARLDELERAGLLAWWENERGIWVPGHFRDEVATRLEDLRFKLYVWKRRAAQRETAAEVMAFAEVGRVLALLDEAARIP
jgi:hypothetical protein